jgi:hypothetical protein
MRRTRRPPSAICVKCGKSIIFDGMLRNPQGVCIPFNSDYSRHFCQGMKMTSTDIDKMTINHLEMMVAKLGKGLQHHKVRLVIEPKQEEQQPQLVALKQDSSF